MNHVMNTSCIPQSKRAPASPMAGAARGALTGAGYIASLKDDREVWLDGERVEVTTHPAFAGALHELARLYDLQHTAEHRDAMTFVSPDTGHRVSYSYHLPRTSDELLAKRRNSDLWAAESWGQMPRIPDFMANVVVGLYDFRRELGRSDPRFHDNVVAYYTHCRENDLALTHAIGDPQIDRSSSPAQDPDLAMRVVRETADGVVVRGAKQLATLAPLSHEVLVYLSPSFAVREQPEYVAWIALPMATPGLKILCREPHSLESGGHSHPFASRYDEQDAMIFFDDVLVPWERVFLLYDGKLALRGFDRINAWALYANGVRFYHRLQTFVGVASMMAKAIGVEGFREVRDRLGELTGYAEMARLILRGMEADAAMTESGLLAPGNTAAIGIFAAQISPRLSEVVREIGASGLVMQPSEADLRSPVLRPYLERYMRGHEVDVEQKSRLFRLAIDLVGSSYGLRQDLYERWNRGDVVRNRIALYQAYDRHAITQRIQRKIRQPLR